MPISYRIDVKRNLVLTTASGALTDDDVLQFKARLVRDPDFGPGMKELSDIRNITRLDVTAAGIQAMVEQDRKDRAAVASHRLAIVVSKDLDFGMARMYQMLTESSMKNVGVFRDIDKANMWLQSE